MSSLTGEIADVAGVHLCLVAGCDAWLESATLLTLRGSELKGPAPHGGAGSRGPRSVVRETAVLVLAGAVAV